MILSVEQKEKQNYLPKALSIKKFLLTEYAIQYHFNSYIYRDQAEFTAFDFLKNPHTFEMNFLIESNQKLFVFLSIAITALILVLILVVIALYKYREFSKLKNQYDSMVMNDKKSDVSKELEESDNHEIMSQTE